MLTYATGVLDVRTFNMDRNSDNILVKMPSSSSTVQLVPIDHGYILPSYKHLEVTPAFCVSVFVLLYQ
jgi:hypothetical protein